jgi:hypothetical protein
LQSRRLLQQAPRMPSSVRRGDGIAIRVVVPGLIGIREVVSSKHCLKKRRCVWPGLVTAEEDEYAGAV